MLLTPHALAFDWPLIVKTVRWGLLIDGSVKHGDHTVAPPIIEGQNALKQPVSPSLCVTFELQLHSW